MLLELIHTGGAGEYRVPLGGERHGIGLDLLLDAGTDLGLGKSLFGRLPGQVGDVIQTRARIRQLAHGGIDALVVAELAQCVVQIAREIADPLEHVVGILGAGCGRHRCDSRRWRRCYRRRGRAGAGIALGGDLLEQGFEIFGFVFQNSTHGFTPGLSFSR